MKMKMEMTRKIRKTIATVIKLIIIHILNMNNALRKNALRKNALRKDTIND